MRKRRAVMNDDTAPSSSSAAVEVEIRVKCLTEIARAALMRGGGAAAAAFTRLLLAIPLISTIENGLDDNQSLPEVVERLFSQLKTLWDWWSSSSSKLTRQYLQLQVAIVDHRPDVRSRIDKVLEQCV